jgi:hypothetical protein
MGFAVYLMVKIKTKKQNQDGIVRLETSGEIKEILLSEDFLNPKNAFVGVCFKGKDSSGIIEFTPRELEIIKREFDGKRHLLVQAKVMKFEK